MRIHDQRNAAWGTRSQIGGTCKEIRDLEGNRDGIWDNEDRAAGETGFWGRNSLAVKLRAFFAPGASTRDDIERLTGFLRAAEAEWGRPVIAPELKQRLKNGDLFALQKAIALKRYGRDPASVVEHFVSAHGTVRGEAIAARRLFTQHFKPTAIATGRVIVVAPGYLETGRNFYEQIRRWNQAGHDVIVMDQQWAGQSDGTPGGVDRGFGIIRDVAAVAAYASELGKRLYGERTVLALYGNSMGGFGVLGAYYANRAGWLALTGAAMPTDVRVITQDAYLEATPTPRNKLLQGLARLPVVNRVQLPMIEGLPELTRDPVAEALVSQGGVLENVHGQLAAFTNVAADVAAIRKLIDESPAPAHPITFVHARRDPLARVEAVAELARKLGPSAKLIALDSDDHVLEQSPTQLGHAVEAVNAALAGD